GLHREEETSNAPLRMRGAFFLEPPLICRAKSLSFAEDFDRPGRSPCPDSVFDRQLLPWSLGRAETRWRWPRREVEFGGHLRIAISNPPQSKSNAAAPLEPASRLQQFANIRNFIYNEPASAGG